MIKFIWTTIFLSLSFEAISCSFAPMVEEFEITGEGNVIPDKPAFVVSQIHRGSKGDIGSCNDAGSITFFLQSEPLEPTGFIFTITEGTFEDQLFHAEPIQRVARFSEPGQFLFRWYDGLTSEQEPINITVQIIGISKSGAKSEPQYIQVTHPGVKKPWWKLW